MDFEEIYYIIFYYTLEFLKITKRFLSSQENGITVYLSGGTIRGSLGYPNMRAKGCFVVSFVHTKKLVFKQFGKN